MKTMIFSLLFVFAANLLTAQDQERLNSVSPDQVKNWKYLSEVLQELDIDRGQKESITYFEVLVKATSDPSLLYSIANHGNEFNEETRALLERRKVGDRIWIDNIKVVNPDGSIDTISVSLKVE